MFTPVEPDSMKPSRHLPLVALLLASVAASAPAQRSDSEWLEDCRDGRRWGRDRERERQCEVRHSGSRAPGGAITIDAGQNGGVYITGWDRDSIDITLRVRADAESVDDARS